MVFIINNGFNGFNGFILCSVGFESRLGYMPQRGARIQAGVSGFGLRVNLLRGLSPPPMLWKPLGAFVAATFKVDSVLNRLRQ